MLLWSLSFTNKHHTVNAYCTLVNQFIFILFTAKLSVLLMIPAVSVHSIL